MTTYFISDLHLSESQPEITHTLLNFLNQLTDTADALYILGDFVEYWVGDDDSCIWFEPVKQKLKMVSQSICPVYFMHGNRDFLIGKKFAQQTGMQILAEPSVIDLYDQKVLIMHGDSLCTQDVSYQKFRKIVRNPVVQFIFGLLPLTTRHHIFGVGRQKSQQKQNDINEKTQQIILDVTPDAVSEIMQQYRVNILIHGHTHRPSIHRNAVKSNVGYRIVLGDWYEHGSILEVDHNGYHLFNFTFIK